MKHAHSTAHWYGKGICIVCGKEYDRYNANAKTCGPECSRKRNREMRDKWGERNPTYQKDVREGLKKTRKQIQGNKTAKSCLNATIDECLNCTRARCIFEDSDVE